MSGCLKETDRQTVHKMAKLNKYGALSDTQSGCICTCNLDQKTITVSGTTAQTSLK